MKQFEYVMSGVSATKIINNYSDKSWYPLYVSLTEQITQAAAARVNTNSDVETKMSLLYNGFTEKGFGVKFKEQRQAGCTHVYSDSGGLQMITLGKTITPELKSKVYVAQTSADYGLCFDTIPLEKISTGVSSSSERTNLSNKLFNQENLVASAKQTGVDVKTQLEYFDSVGAKTKVIIIVQGNTWQDMVIWFDELIKQIPTPLRKGIQGIAVADTCMGNGEVETVEMMIAARKIADTYGEEYVKHIHLLGVGSIARLRPTMMLLRSGYLSCVDRVSFDSTSHTHNAMMGKHYTRTGVRTISAFRTGVSVGAWSSVYNTNHALFSPHLDLDTWLSLVFGEDGKWTSSSIHKNANGAHSDTVHAIMAAAIWAYTVEQVETFLNNVHHEYTKKIIRGDAISELYYVKTHEDMDNWMQTYSSRCKSARIVRAEDQSSLTGFF